MCQLADWFGGDTNLPCTSSGCICEMGFVGGNDSWGYGWLIENHMSR